QETGYASTEGSVVVPSNIYDPTPLPPGPAERPTPQKASDTKLTSFAIADTLSFLDDRVLLTVGARRQTVDVDSYDTLTGAVTSRYRASATSPLAGIVVKPLYNVSVYANYTEGLSKGALVGPDYAN